MTQNPFLKLIKMLATILRIIERGKFAISLSVLFVFMFVLLFRAFTVQIKFIEKSALDDMSQSIPSLYQDYVEFEQVLIEPTEVVYKVDKNVFELYDANMLNRERQQEFIRLVNKYSIKENIDPRIFYYYAAVESDFKWNAESVAGWNAGWGLFQISKVCRIHYNNTHDNKIKPDELRSLENQFIIFCWYYKYLKKNYSKYFYGEEDVYICYNVGATNFTKYYNYYRNDKLPCGNKYNARKRWSRITSQIDSIFNTLG
jgi:hypothetical protein